MDRLEQIRFLNGILLEELPQYRGLLSEKDPRRLLRGLMNLRPPLPLRADFLAVQDALLSAEREARGVVEGAALPPVPAHPGVSLWQGDITRLRVDAIVNAANSALLGCFCPGHACIDNVIHSAAGLQLRDACNQLMQAQGHSEPTGRAKLTSGFNLPCRFVLHTVGPIVSGPLTERHRAELAACYASCLALAAREGLASVAFCCVSTGEFHFPHQEAAQIAVQTVMDFLKKGTSIRKVIFNVFKDCDAGIYRQLLGLDGAARA